MTTAIQHCMPQTYYHPGRTKGKSFQENTSRVYSKMSSSEPSLVWEPDVSIPSPSGAISTKMKIIAFALCFLLLTSEVEGKSHKHGKKEKHHKQKAHKIVHAPSPARTSPPTPTVSNPNAREQGGGSQQPDYSNSRGYSREGRHDGNCAVGVC